MIDLIDEIKKEAKSKNVRIQDSKCLKLEEILNSLFYLPKNKDEEARFIRNIIQKGQKDMNRKGLHASGLTVSDDQFCIREQVLSLIFKQRQNERLPVDTLRIFEQGNAIHEKWQRLFLRAGFSRYFDLDVTKFKKEYLINFTPDIICVIPDMFGNEKVIGEIKSMNTFQFEKVNRHPTAYKQLEWYMYLSGIHKGFVLTEDKNTQRFMTEIYDFDYEQVRPFIKRLKEVNVRYQRYKESGKMVKREKRFSELSERCKKCPMLSPCWYHKGEYLDSRL